MALALPDPVDVVPKSFDVPFPESLAVFVVVPRPLNDCVVVACYECVGVPFSV